MIKSFKIKSLFLFVALLGSVGLFAQNANVSDAELGKFANAYLTLQKLNQQAEQEMVAIIEKEGMKPDRFGEIEKAAMANQESNASAAEMAMHDKAMAKIEQMQPELERKAKEGIEAKGLTFDRFKELAAVIQQDQSLQQRLQDIFMKNQGK